MLSGMSSSTPKEVIEGEGLQYLGEQQRPGGKPPYHCFNYVQDSIEYTLYLEAPITPETVAAKVAEIRSKIVPKK